MSAAPNRPSRRSAKGQAMAIFALVSVLLFVVAGLSIDAGTSYLTSNKIERAAAAAALAGVAYLPGDIPDALNAALVEAARDGFPNAGAGKRAEVPQHRHASITSEPTTNELKVTISATVGTIFLRIVGFGSHTVVRSETAQYLPPISLGQPGGQQGSRSLGSELHRAAQLLRQHMRPASAAAATTTTSSARKAGATHAPKVTRSRRRPLRRTTDAAPAAATTAARPRRLTTTPSALRPAQHLRQTRPSTTREGRTT